MEDQHPNNIDLEKELETLYLKTATPDQLEDILDTLPASTTNTAGIEKEKLHDTQTSHDKDKKKRVSFHLFFRPLSLVLILVLLLGLIAVFLWPEIYHYDALKSDGKIYPIRINRFTGETAYFDGREWSHPPVSPLVKRPVSEIPVVQPVGAISPDMQQSDKKTGHAPGASAPEKSHGETGYAIQIKAFPEDKKNDALLFMKDVKRQWPDVRLETVYVPERGLWHRILLGHFMSMENALDSMKKYNLPVSYPGSFIQKESG